MFTWLQLTPPLSEITTKNPRLIIYRIRDKLEFNGCKYSYRNSYLGTCTSLFQSFEIVGDPSFYLSGFIVNVMTTMAYFHCQTRIRTRDTDSCTMQILWERDPKMFCIILCSHRVCNPNPSPNLKPSPAVEMSHDNEY